MDTFARVRELLQIVVNPGSNCEVGFDSGARRKRPQRRSPSQFEVFLGIRLSRRSIAGTAKQTQPKPRRLHYWALLVATLTRPQPRGPAHRVGGRPGDARTPDPSKVRGSYVSDVVEHNGARSNPQVTDESLLLDLCWDDIFKLFQLKQECLSRKRAPKRAAQVPPRTCVPLLATITQVLELANHEPMRVRDIHRACEELLKRPVSYRSLKSSLWSHSHTRKPRFRRVRPGWYGLKIGL
jgi:hypothetical protein